MDVKNDKNPIQHQISLPKDSFQPEYHNIVT